MSQLSSMKEILDIWNENVLSEGLIKENNKVSPVKEHRGKSLCDGDAKERRICQDRDKASRERSTKKRNDKRRTWPGKEDMDRLAKGIAQEELIQSAKKEKKKNCGPGNPRHDELGRFSDKDSNTSWGLGGYGRSDGKCQSGKSQMKPGSNRRYITKHKCGSKTTGAKGGEGKERYRCKDKTAIWEVGEQDSDWVKVKKDVFTRLIGTDYSKDDDNDIQLFEDYINMQEAQPSKIATYCRSKGFMTFKDYLLKINAINRSEKGDLLDDPKKSNK
jgi:hypothetical protein